MGILARHMPSIEQLKPGLVEVFEESGGSKQFFSTSSLYQESVERPPRHFLTWKSSLRWICCCESGLAIEAYPVEDFSAESVRSQIAEAQKVQSGGGSERDVAEAGIELEVSVVVSACYEIIDSLLGSRELAKCPEIDVCLPKIDSLIRQCFVK